MNIHRRALVAAFVAVLSLAALGYWITGPVALAPWDDASLRDGNVGPRATKDKTMPAERYGLIDKISLPALVQSLFVLSAQPNAVRLDEFQPTLAEKTFLSLMATEAMVGALLALTLLYARRGHAAAELLAQTLGLFALAVAFFLVNGQARLRGNIFVWPSWWRLLSDVTATLAFGLSVTGLERFFSIYPVKLEDWQVMQTLLSWRGRSIVAAQKIQTVYRSGRTNLLWLARMIPRLVMGLFLVGAVFSTLPFLLVKISFPLGSHADNDQPVFSLAQKLGMGALASSLLSLLGAFLLLVAFGWLLSAALVGKLRASREQCTEDERRQADWLFAGGVVMVLMLTLFSAGLVLLVAYQAWGDNHVVREYGSMVFIFFLPAGWAIMLVALTGAVFLGRSFGPKPLLKRTMLIAAAGVLMSVLLTMVQHLLTEKLFSHSSAAIQNGVSTLLAGGLSAACLGLVRGRMDRGIEGFLNRFMPATVIADGKRRERAVVFSDLGGYTALSAADEPQALHVAGHFQKAAADVARRHGGRIVKTIGDAVLWVFATPAEAFAAALQLAEKFHEAVQADKLSDLPVNSGVHFGSLVEAPDGDVYGAAVNLAARLQGAASHGAVVASSEAMLEVSGGFRFEPMGKLELKNVPTPIACFRVSSASA